MTPPPTVPRPARAILRGSVISALYLEQAYLAQPLSQIRIGGDGSGVTVRICRRDTSRQRHDREIACKVQEVRHRVARRSASSGLWIDDAVRGRGQNMIGQPLEHVADIDDEGASGRIDRQPIAVSVEQLQPRLFGPQQQRDEIDILVRACAHDTGG